jgi:hypothetical protein
MFRDVYPGSWIRIFFQSRIRNTCLNSGGVLIFYLHLQYYSTVYNFHNTFIYVQISGIYYGYFKHFIEYRCKTDLFLLKAGVRALLLV